MVTNQIHLHGAGARQSEPEVHHWWLVGYGPPSNFGNYFDLVLSLLLLLLLSLLLLSGTAAVILHHFKGALGRPAFNLKQVNECGPGEPHRPLGHLLVHLYLPNLNLSVAY